MNFSVPALDRLVAERASSGAHPPADAKGRNTEGHSEQRQANALHGLLASITGLVRSAQAIPAGDEYSIRTSNAEAAKETHQAAAETLEVLSLATSLGLPGSGFADASRANIYVHRNLSGVGRDAAGDAGAANVERAQERRNLFPAFQDFLDDLLDDVDKAIAFHERHPNAPLPPPNKLKNNGVSGGDAGASDGRASNSLFPEGHITALSLASSSSSSAAARASPRAGASLAACGARPGVLAELASAVRNRPQRQWLHLIDNFAPRFVPRLPHKPHAREPLHPAIVRAQAVRLKRMRRLRKLLDGEDDGFDDAPQTQNKPSQASADSPNSANAAERPHNGSRDAAAASAGKAETKAKGKSAASTVVLPPSLSLHLHGRGVLPTAGSGGASAESTGSPESPGQGASPKRSVEGEETEPLPHVYEAELSELQWKGEDGQAVDGIFGGSDLFEICKPRRWKPLKDTPLVRISTKEELQAIVDELSSGVHPLVAIDLEHHSFHSYRGFTCLIQLSTREKDYLIDPFPLFEQLHVLNAVTANPRILKIFHGSESDIIWLQRDFSVYVVNMFDTCVAARALALPGGASLANLLHTYCDVEANKQYQLADWRRRPLTPELELYARSDTHYLPYIFDVMKNQLLSRPDMGGAVEGPAVSGLEEGLQVTEAGAQAMQVTMERSRDICLKTHVQGPFDAPTEAELLLKRNRAGLSPLSYVVFIELLKWRDNLARRQDRSPVSLATPAHLLLLAQKRPTSTMEFNAAIRPAPPTLRHHTRELIQLVQKSLLDAAAAQRAANAVGLSPSLPPTPSAPGSPEPVLAAIERSASQEEKKSRKRKSRPDEDDSPSCSSSDDDEALLPQATLLEQAARKVRLDAAQKASGSSSPCRKKEFSADEVGDVSAGACESASLSAKSREGSGMLAPTGEGETATGDGDAKPVARPRGRKAQSCGLIVAAGADGESLVTVHSSLGNKRRRVELPRVTVKVVPLASVDAAAYPDFFGRQRSANFASAPANCRLRGDAKSSGKQASTDEVVHRVYEQMKLVERHHLLVSHEVLGDPFSCLCLPASSFSDADGGADGEANAAALPAACHEEQGPAGACAVAPDDASSASSSSSFFPLLCAVPVPPPPAALLSVLAERDQEAGRSESDREAEGTHANDGDAPEGNEFDTGGDVVIVSQQTKWKRKGRKRGKCGKQKPSEQGEKLRESGAGRPAAIPQRNAEDAKASGVRGGGAALRAAGAASLAQAACTVGTPELPLLAPDAALRRSKFMKDKKSQRPDQTPSSGIAQVDKHGAAPAESAPIPASGEKGGQVRHAEKSKKGRKEVSFAAGAESGTEDSGTEKQKLSWLPAAFLSHGLTAAGLTVQQTGGRRDGKGSGKPPHFKKGKKKGFF
ncbi:3'-5' exonuclease domain-containing protein [Besnoitia besnoiti]|uniref:3'-5' exonuclease domain-containing protein n=1 Tax=Besnoitia besnoiti TaxID=94643 RepID=A0A2A9MIA5_BESBE|nr:3'-5' exonuclease domain-containing protein [Besnoitia besnoiti]PFH38268.1 3'-5' exonuclease domain-containing protein [Besnoitia besnoiti]